VTVGAVFSNIYQPKIMSYYNYKTYKHLKTHCVNFLHCLLNTRGVSLRVIQITITADLLNVCGRYRVADIDLWPISTLLVADMVFCVADIAVADMVCGRYRCNSSNLSTVYWNLLIVYHSWVDGQWHVWATVWDGHNI